MTKETGTPQIRFSGYNDTWEQRKLNEVAEFNPKSGLPESFEYVDLESVVGTEMVSHRTETKETAPSRAQRLAQTGDVFFQTVRPYQRNNYLFAKPDNNYVFSTGYAQMRPKIDAEFLMCFLQTDSFVKIVLDNCTGTSYPAINSNDLSNLEIDLPTSEDEQRRIGCFITNIDRLITLHQRKYDKLVKVKKSMLEKMFPRKGAKVPEIRFYGFTDDWEQRKFSEGVSEIGDGLHGTPIYCEDGNVSFINGNNLVDGKIVISAETKKVNECQQSTADKSLDDTTILMSINGTIGNLAYYSGERLMLGKSAAYIKVSEFDKRFVYAYLQAPSVQGYFMDSLTGTTIKNLGLKAIREMIMFIPQDVDEQKRIGKFFDYLDHLITLHQRKLEKLKNLKKACLKKMFI